MKSRYNILFLTVIAIGLLSNESLAQSKYTSINYNISVPLGLASDYTSNTSFRGFSIESGKFMNDNFKVGVAFSWNVFNETVSDEPYMEDNLTLTGKQFRYTNSFPIYLNGTYIIGGKSAKTKPYIGLGLGTIANSRSTEIGAYVVKNTSWHFNIAPQAGLMFDLNGYMNLNLGATYMYGMKTGSADAIEYIRTNIGLTYFFF